jgi:hypothetical protein
MLLKSFIYAPLGVLMTFSVQHRFFESLTAEDHPDDKSDRGENDVSDLFRYVMSNANYY